MKIEDVDKNFAVPENIQRDGLKLYDALSEPFSVHGVFFENKNFVRMPQSLADSVSEGVGFLNRHCAGGRIRFMTDSRYVAVCGFYNDVGKMPHFALTGSAGFDVYADGVYVGTVFPQWNMTDRASAVVDLDGKMHEITVNMPLYSGLDKILIGLDENAALSPAPAYTAAPTVYYGSSITQGGCASRPGNSYQAIIHRRLGTDYINLGFSGSAKSEQVICDYMANLKMSAFVLDYDHNAPTPEHLNATHYNVYKTVRSKNPDIPVIMLTRPKTHLSTDELERLSIVRESYEKALSEGDKNVYFIPGPELVSLCPECATVDNSHPNDAGFLSMANKIEPLLRSVLKL